MEITTDGRITLRFYRNAGEMDLSSTGAAYLKMPKCIQLHEKDNFSKLIIQTCELGTPDSFPIVGKNYSYSHGGISIKSTTLIFKIWNENKWVKNSHYVVDGVIDFDQPDKIMFDLSKAEPSEGEIK